MDSDAGTPCPDTSPMSDIQLLIVEPEHEVVEVAADLPGSTAIVACRSNSAGRERRKDLESGYPSGSCATRGSLSIRSLAAAS